ncbi:MAG: hypothetical protein IPO08_17095 [Xanthomonadales bacterium]|nr:hypothetical protein [Xanthomonadales bacterium]
MFDANGERRLAFGTIDVGALEANGDGATQLTATASNTSFNEVGVTPFPVPLIASDKLVATAHRSTPALPGSAQRLGVYLNGGASVWSVFFQDFTQNVPTGQRFSVLAAAQVLSGGQIVRELPLFHRLLDDNACAAPLIGRTDDPLDSNTTLNAQGFSVEYRAPSGPGAPGRWFVVAEANTSVSAPSNPITEGVAVPSFPPNAAFNLIVDGGQAESCRARARQHCSRMDLKAVDPPSVRRHPALRMSAHGGRGRPERAFAQSGLEWTCLIDSERLVSATPTLSSDAPVAAMGAARRSTGEVDVQPACRTQPMG